MEKWFIKNKKADYKSISKDFGISTFIARLLVNRDIVDYDLIKSFIEPSLDKLYCHSRLKDMIIGVNILLDRIKNRKKIRIVGDFDVDGIISVFILYKGIKSCGGIVDFVIPDRVEEGYGLNKQIIEKAKEDGIDTILTCDNGIAALEEIKFAKELGLTVIVTDHHDVPYILDEEDKKVYLSSQADAIINPKQLNCKYPFDKLCGAGVAFKLIQGLYEKMNKSIESTYPLLEFVAIATVCDVVDLIDENRVIVNEGLKLINNTQNIGLKALIQATGLEEKEIGVYHLGFIIGPCINATGRLDTAIKAIELLLSEDKMEAADLAQELRDLNEERKSMTTEGVDQIVEKIESSNLIEDKVLVIYEPRIHESIAGIIAGRIKERYYKPTIVLTHGKEGVKGSGRSIGEYNMFEELTECKDLLNRFGGHPMAAGLSLDLENIEKFRIKLNDITSLTQEDLIPKIYLDMELPIQHISFSLIEQLDILEPFGKGNSKPIFGAKDLIIRRAQILGVNKNVLKLNLQAKGGTRIEGLYFGDIKAFEEEVLNIYGQEEAEKLFKGFNNNISFDIIFSPNVNEYMGNKTLQVIIQSYRWKS